MVLAVGWGREERVEGTGRMEACIPDGCKTGRSVAAAVEVAVV